MSRDGRRFPRTGPKRRRRSRRELPEGGYTQWMSATNFKRERIARRLAADDRSIREERE